MSSTLGILPSDCLIKGTELKYKLTESAITNNLHLLSLAKNLSSFKRTAKQSSACLIRLIP